MTATTPRKRTTTTRKRVAGATESNVIQLDRPENVAEIEAIIADREPLFSLGGKTYTIPKTAPAAWMIKTLELAKTVGDSTAVEYALQKMLGVDGYKAIAECETLTMGDFTAIRDEVVKRVLPQAPKAS